MEFYTRSDYSCTDAQPSLDKFNDRSLNQLNSSKYDHFQSYPNYANPQISNKMSNLDRTIQNQIILDKSNSDLNKTTGSVYGSSSSSSSKTQNIQSSSIRSPKSKSQSSKNFNDLNQNDNFNKFDGRKKRPNISQKFSTVLGKSSKSSSSNTLGNHVL